MLAIVGFLQGALLFAGLGLGINSIFFDDINWLFLFLLGITGGIVGSLLGLFIRQAEPPHAWAIPVGSFLLAFMVMGLMIAFDFFIFGAGDMHWRGIFTVGLISTAPGLFIGWMLAQQLGGETRSSQLGATRGTQASPRQNPVAGATGLSARPVPGPMISGQTDQGNTLEQRLQQEISRLPPNFQNTELFPVSGTDGAICVTTQLRTRTQNALKLYVTCRADYPHSPPDLYLENVNPYRPDEGVEIPLRPLRVLGSWSPGYKLSDIAHEIAEMYG